MNQQENTCHISDQKVNDKKGIFQELVEMRRCDMLHNIANNLAKEPDASKREKILDTLSKQDKEDVMKLYTLYNPITWFTCNFSSQHTL